MNQLSEQKGTHRRSGAGSWTMNVFSDLESSPSLAAAHLVYSTLEGAGPRPT
jgi:hypothetical protein